MIRMQKGLLVGAVACLVLAPCLSIQLRANESDVVYLSEGFNQLVLPTGWSISQIVGPTATWTIIGNGVNPPTPPFSGAGQAKFNSFDAGTGQQARLTTRAINLSPATDPMLQFYMYHDDEFTASMDSLYVEVSTADSITGPWTVLSGFGRLRPSSGWQGETIPLTALIGNPRVFIGFRGVSKFGNNIFLDEVAVLDSVTIHDIGAIGIFVVGQTSTPDGSPASRFNLTHDRNDFAASLPRFTIVDRADALAFGVIIQNFGTVREIAYQVKWMVDGVPQIPVDNLFDLERNGRDTLYLNWQNPTPGTHLITAWASLVTDTNHLNDTVRITVQIPDSSVVLSETFNGSIFPPPGWTVINRDGGTLLPWFQGTAASPLTPFEGAGFAADNFQRANGAYLDDYLVSPPVSAINLPNQSDSLVFWCRSTTYPPPNPNYPDSLMILLSTTGTDTSNFTTLVDYFQVPKLSWTRRAYRLSTFVPQNSTVRVAFRYLHYNAANADFIGIDAVQFSSVTTSVEEEERVPTTFLLHQNYPNPFNPSTTVQFDLPETSDVTLTVYDVLGRQVLVLPSGKQTAGFHQITWNGVSSAGTAMSSGVYLYRLEARSNGKVYTDMKKMILLK